MKPDNPNRNADVREILEIGESLGSKELSAEYKKYKTAQKNAELKKNAKKQAEKKGNEKNIVKKQ